MPNPKVRQPVRAPKSLAQDSSQVPLPSRLHAEHADPVASQLGPIYTWTPAMQEEFSKVFETESRRLAHSENLQHSAMQQEDGFAAISEFEALAEQLVGEWEAVHERGRLRIHVIERDGFG